MKVEIVFYLLDILFMLKVVEMEVVFFVLHFVDFKDYLYNYWKSKVIEGKNIIVFSQKKLIIIKVFKFWWMRRLPHNFNIKSTGERSSFPG